MGRKMGREKEKLTIVCRPLVCCLELLQPRYTVNKTWQAGGEEFIIPDLKVDLPTLSFQMDLWLRQVKCLSP